MNTPLFYMPSNAPLAPGALLQGRYQIAGVAAQGGQGTVYKAVDARTTRDVAVKAVRLEAIATQQEYTEAVQRIAQEAQLLGRLSHPNIVQVIDHFVENGYPFVVMEFVQGCTLEAAVATSGGRLSEPEALFVARQLCSALGYLHSQNPPIIFRDLKPANVMVDGYQTIKLIDFGIARRYKRGSMQDTESFVSMGYAPPEQFGHGQTDARSDIYAFGVTLHHLLTGYDPSTNPMDALPPARKLAPTVSAEVEQLIAKMTDKSPLARPQTIAEVEQVLARRSSQPTRFLGKTIPGARPTAQWAARLGRFSNTQVAAGVAAGAGLAVLFTLALAPFLFSALKFVPFLSIVAPLIFALARKRWAVGLGNAVVCAGLGFALTAGLAGLPLALSRVAWIASGALASGIAVEIVSASLLERPPGTLTWKAEAIWCGVMGVLTFTLFYPVLSIRPDTALNFTSLTYPLSWALAFILGVLGWAAGDLLQQRRALAAPVIP